MGRDINVYDEGLIVFGAIRVMNGDVPYRDFYANYGPAQFYVLAGLFKVFGPSILISRIWDTFWCPDYARNPVRDGGRTRSCQTESNRFAIGLV
jgi:hypothetical protein